MADPAVIAASLTEAQRKVLREPYSHGGQFDDARVRFSLISRGLIVSGQGLRLSPLGLAVRAELERKSDGSQG